MLPPAGKGALQSMRPSTLLHVAALATLPLYAAMSLALGGCTVGDVTGVRVDAGADDGVDADPSAPDADPAAPDAASALTCRDEVANPGNGEHNAGQACIACHAGNGGPDYTVAGTLYSDAAGTAPVAGATITVVDANGVEVDLVTRTNGNFWTEQNLAFPVQVMASRCPTAVPMIAAVSNGDCNVGGCHAVGAPSGRIHLP